MSHILIVDDETKIREIIKKYAIFEGHEVSEASCGLDAVNICRQTQFDIIILDIKDR
jgi:DNA-binding response OmpR family regulator